MRKHNRLTVTPRLLLHGYIQMPQAYIYADLPRGAKHLLTYLLHLQYQHRTYPGDAQAAHTLNCSTKSISRWLKTLRDAHIVTIDPQGPYGPEILLDLPSMLPDDDQPANGRPGNH